MLLLDDRLLRKKGILLGLLGCAVVGLGKGRCKGLRVWIDVELAGLRLELLLVSSVHVVSWLSSVDVLIAPGVGYIL